MLNELELWTDIMHFQLCSASGFVIGRNSSSATMYEKVTGSDPVPAP